jgi:hypothetical protein
MNKLIRIVVTCTFTTLCWFPVAYAEHGVDCSNAENDISHLQHEKASTVERAAKGVTSVMPIGLAIHTVVIGDEGQNLEIATGDYNDQLDARIAEIKRECGL